MEKTIIAGRRNGLHLDQEKRDRVKAVKKKISELGTQFGANLNEDTTAIDFAATELDGVPTDLVDSFDKVDIYFSLYLEYRIFVKIGIVVFIYKTMFYWYFQLMPAEISL